MRAMVSFEYRDLLVSLWRDETPGLFRARAEEDFGRSTPPVPVYLPFDDRWFVQYQERLAELSSRELHYVGARLFDSLFHGDILRLYVHLLDQIRITETKLRIRLELTPPIVSRLPWECLYDTRTGSFLSASSDVTLVRYHRPRGREPAAVPARRPLRVLLVADGSHGDAGDKSVSRQARTVREALAPLESASAVSVEESGAALGGDPLDIEALATLAARRFDAVHLLCDAEWDGVRARFVLGEAGVSLDALARALEAANPCLVVWGGGESAGAVGPELARALLDEIPALVCHRRAIPGELLGRHTTVFYEALAARKPVDQALADGRAAILSQFPGEGEWIAPSLALSRKDASILYNPTPTRVSDVYQISEGRYRRALREGLNRFWPKPERYFPQQVRWMPRGAPLSSYVLDGEFMARPQTVDELSRRFQHLFLLGEAGSGKTMALCRLFYELAQPILSYQRKSPLPVYVSAPDLGDGTDLFELLAKGFDRDLFRSDLEEGRFLFLLDSLDGLSAAGASRRARALNAFLRRFPMNRFVVTARRPAAAALDVSSWAEIVPLAEWEAIDYLVADEAIRPEAARPLYRQLAQALGPRSGNPQLLALARRLWREGARVPPSATEMFLSFFRVAGSSMVPDMREGLLPQLAFFMTRGDRLSLSREYLEQRAETAGLEGLAGEVASRAAGVMSAGEILAEVEKTRLLRGPRAFTFPNLAFQEFLTAYALRFAAPNAILSLVPPADFRDPEGEESSGRPINLSLAPFHGALPFLCGLRDDGPELVEWLSERDIVLASQCFREARPNAGVDRLLRETVDAFLRSGDAMRERVAVLALEARGDAWAVPLLEEVASRAGASGRFVALKALGNLRSHRSVEVLEAAAGDGDPVVAQAAQDALARIEAG